MSTVKMYSNTDKYKCVFCGSPHVSVIREDATNPKLKCNNCNRFFTGEDSLGAEKAGAIPTSSPETLAAAEEAASEQIEGQGVSEKVRERLEYETYKAIPRVPKYVFISKNRKIHEFCNDKDLKKTALNWEAVRKYDLFELHIKKSVVRLDIE